MPQKKQLLALFASPHEKGRTAALLTSFLAPFRRQEGWEIHVADVYALNAGPCTDCGYCRKTEGCAFHDLDGLDGLLRQSDALVIASPVYNFSFPAPMKAVLDRTQRYFSARFSLGLRPPVKKRREAALLLSMGSREPEGRDVPRFQLERAFTVMNTALRGTVCWQGTDRGESAGEAEKEAANALALEIIGET